jgi:hypothetical protein
VWWVKKEKQVDFVKKDHGTKIKLGFFPSSFGKVFKPR